MGKQDICNIKKDKMVGEKDVQSTQINNTESQKYKQKQKNKRKDRQTQECKRSQSKMR